MEDDSSSSENPTGRKSELYREITPDSFWGYIRPGHLEATFFTTQLDTISSIIGSKQKGPEFIAEINIKFTPQMAKQFAFWIVERLILYNKLYGEILLDKHVDPADLKISEDVKSKFDELLRTV
jgi:hypothetical protein